MAEDADIARAIVVNEGEVLILQNSDNDDQQYARGKWEIPGGLVEDHDEHVERAVRREVEEETGLDIDIEEKREKVTVEMEGNTTDCQYYLARSDSRYVELSDEHQGYRWIEPGDAREIDWYYYSTYMIPVLERLEEDL